MRRRPYHGCFRSVYLCTGYVYRAGGECNPPPGGQHFWKHKCLDAAPGSRPTPYNPHPTSWTPCRLSTVRNTKICTIIHTVYTEYSVQVTLRLTFNILPFDLAPAYYGEKGRESNLKCIADPIHDPISFPFLACLTPIPYPIPGTTFYARRGAIFPNLAGAGRRTATCAVDATMSENPIVAETKSHAPLPRDEDLQPSNIIPHRQAGDLKLSDLALFSSGS